MQTITIVGIVASTLTASSMLPQLIKIIKEKKANDVSITMLVVLFAGVAAWVYYGILKKDAIIIISNALSLLLNIALVIVSLKYKQADNK